ncbi:MAG: hypothetical protein VB084_10015 [Syntrophomonadaceae bacterium]|nr:hypothetical protein [Syntrophomonadaceae bacterium]
MKVGIKYCGGCNPTIDRANLTKRLREKLEPGKYTFEYFDFHDCEVVLVINGCSVGCTKIPKSKNTIIVSGSEMDGKQYPEEMLSDQVVRKLESYPVALN